MLLRLILLLSILLPVVVEAGTVTRPTKTNSLTGFTNGMTPTAADLNGDPDTIYAEFNGNISNINISASAAIAATKISVDGVTTNVRNVSTAPCHIWEESDQSADAKRWAACLIAGEFRLSTHTDAGGTQNDWFKIARTTGSVTMGGVSGTNTINGVTNFNQQVNFLGNTSLLPTGVVIPYVSTSSIPAGWINANGASNSCTGSSSANAGLCALLIANSSGFKGSASGTITVDTSSNEIIHTTHGRVVNDRVHFSTTTTLPAPLNTTALYCIISVTTDRFKVSTTCGGGEVDITSSGSGTQSDHFNFVTPNLAGRAVIGTGTGVGLTNRTMFATGGEENHLLSTTEMPSHTHTFTGPGSVQNNAAGGGQPVITSVNAGAVTNSTGGGATHNVMDPFYVLNYIIKL